MAPLMSVYTHNPLIETKDVARFISGSNRIKISKSIYNKVVAFNDKVISSLNPRITYNTYRITAADGHSVVLENGAVFSSPKLSKTMRSSREIVCFLATAGPKLDAEISRLTAQGRVSSAYILDAMGSLLVESVVAGFQEKTSKSLRPKDKGVTLRFSPGYCDWPLTQQGELFGLFDAQGLGVKLSRSCLMTPRKSISGVFGIYPLDGVSAPYIPCWECGRRGCSSRRALSRKSASHPSSVNPT